MEGTKSHRIISFSHRLLKTLLHFIGSSLGKGYDQNWVISRQDDGQIITIATLYDPTTGRCMDISTDQVGLQFYSGNFFDGSYSGKYGKAIKYRESLALETQKHPDAINHENFPSVVLNPDETYTQTCIYKFYTK